MIRLILLILLFLASLLTVFRAPTNLLWMTAIAVSEYCWILIFVTCLILTWGFIDMPYKTIGTVFGFIAVLLFISPIVRATIVSTDLKSELTQSLKCSDSDLPERSAFSVAKLFSIKKKVEFQSYVYQNDSGQDYKLDFYPSQISGERPCVMVVHGGSWSSGDSQQLPELNSYLASIGYNVASINYHLSPKYRSPRPVNDVKLALKYLKENSDKFNIDTSNFVLVGRSAGAQIVLMAAYTLNDTAIKGVVDFYGPADMSWGYTIPPNPLVMDSEGVMEDYLGGTLSEVPNAYAESSAVNYVNKNSTPTLMLHGKNDVLVAYEHCARLEKKLIASGVKYYWLKLPWATHGFDYNLRGPGGQLSTYATEAFIKSVTKK